MQRNNLEITFQEDEDKEEYRDNKKMLTSAGNAPGGNDMTSKTMCPRSPSSSPENVRKT